MRFVKLENISIGDVTAAPVYDYNNRLLIASGKEITIRMLESFRNIGITGLYIEDKLFDDFVIDETISHELKAKIIKNLKHLNIDSALGNARDIVDVLTENPQCEYLDLKTFDNYTYEHSISVAVYATLVGIADCMTKEQLYKLAYAGLLHDIGKMSISEEILNKPGKLTFEEYEEMKHHPEYGFNMLKDNIEISATTRMGVFEHHENEDGSGYPRGITGDKIYKFAKIIHVVDVYDALATERPYKKALTPVESLKYLHDNAGTMFDRYYLEIFSNVVPAYSKGVTVSLSNGEKGVVIENHVGQVLRPTIKLFNGAVIDLSKSEEYKDILIL